MRIKMILSFYLLGCALLAASMDAQPPSEKRWINRLKSTLVSEIDSTLPAKPFDTWLKEIVGPEQPVYEVNDCGERNGTPEERGKHFPLCVNVTSQVGPARKANLTFVVGTYVVPTTNRRKTREKPAKIELFYGDIGPSDPRSKQPTMKIDRLSDLLKFAGKN